MTAIARRARRVAVLLAAATLAGVAHGRIDTRTRVSKGEMMVPPAERARLATLGFDALVADYYWLQAVQIVGGAKLGIVGRAPLVADLMDVTTTVDPWVDHAYRFAAVWLTDSEDSVERANRLLERGIAYHPLDWRNRYHLAFNLFFYLERNAEAADVLEPAIELEGAPLYLGALVARLRADGLDLATAEAFLREVSRTTEDPYARAQYLKALDEIQTEHAARFLDRARVEFWRRHGRDIESPADLVRGPRPVLRGLPPAHPHFDGFRWKLDDETDQIVSSFYGSRYGVHVHPLDAERRERWQREREAREREQQQEGGA